MAETCRIVALGGLGEVGKNMTVYECQGEIVVVDAGLAFPRDEHLGVDLVLPDFSYLRERASSIRAVILTHGHEDHVGSLPYLMREVDIPEVWATRLTLGLIKSKLDEHGLLRAAELREVHPDDPPRELGPFRIELVRMAHSIPDAVAIVLETPAGRIVHTGDYKLDHTPVDGLKTDVGRLADLGNRGVDLVLGDSTNAERPGFTPSERIVGEAFRQIFPLREGRILVSSFASNVHRMQQAIDVAVGLGRKVCIVGRSMRKNANIARNLGYMDVPEGVLIRPADLEELRAARAADPLHRQPGRASVGADSDRVPRPSGLARRARRHRRHLREAGSRATSCACTTRSTSSRRRARRCCTRRSRRCTSPATPARKSCARCCRCCGRAPSCRCTASTACRPRTRSLRGTPACRQPSIILAENGTVVELSREGVRVVDEVETGVAFVDGLGVGDVQDVALRDRRRLSEDGVLIIVATLASSNGGSAGPPELIARGFGDGSGPLLDELRDEANRVLQQCLAGRHQRDQAPAGAPPRRSGPIGLRQNPPPADDPSGSG